MQQIKGSVLKSRVAFIEDNFGKEQVGRVLDSLSDDDRRQLGRILTVAWYPFELGKRFDDAIVRVLGNSDPKVFERLGEVSAEKNLSTIHRAFLTRGDAHGFLAKAGVIYSLYYEQGRREYEPTGEQEGLLTTYDAETFSSPDCRTVVGWYRKALEMCGVKGVKVVEEKCRARGDEVCRYRVSWQ